MAYEYKKVESTCRVNRRQKTMPPAAVPSLRRHRNAVKWEGNLRRIRSAQVSAKSVR